MNTLKFFIKKYLKHFAYFYHYLRYRIFIALGLSLAVGTLDGFGLAMFLPLLQMVDEQKGANPETMGNLRFLVDGMAGIGIPLTVVSVLLVILGFYVLKGFARFGESYYKMVLSKYFIKKLRFANIDKLSNYNYKAFVMADVGRIQNTLSGEIAKILSAYKSYFLAVQAGVMVMVYVFLAFLANPQFAVLVAIGGISSNLIYQRIYTKTKEASKKLTLSGHRFQALLIQKVAFFKYLKATGLMRKYGNKLKDIILETERISMKMGWYNAILSSTKEPVVVTVVVMVIIVQVTYFSTSMGLIILSLLFFYRSMTFMMNVQIQWNSFLIATGSLENMTEFMNELQANQEKNGTEKMTRFTHSLELKNVTFSYGHSPILKDFSLIINRNETIAFVGESGSGKTTLVNIFTGLLPVDSGVFLIDGRNARDFNMATYQQRLGYITQEPVIFSDTIFNNITFWAERTPENERKFWEAVEKASIGDFIRSLPGKEESLLGNNGILVSGGQKQRLSIARELYKDVDILIMDEATSALDSETERTIQTNIDALKGRYTILIVAHRLATIKNADRVVLLSQGKIESVGTFDQLKHSSRLFEKMVELQEI
jgi:ABC-type multidrug transport system fused ATPase/permease subunit